MCRCLRIHPSGFCAWLKNPLSKRAQEDARQSDLIRRAWKDSGEVIGYRKLHDDLLDQGETCCPNRVACLAKLAGIKAQIAYKRWPGTYGGKPSVIADNTLDRRFDVEAPGRVSVTDITYIRTLEGFVYLAVVIDLYSRRVVGWSLQSRKTTDFVLQALLMAVWRRKSKNKLLIHSDQGSQFTSMDWASFLRHHNLEHSMSRRGNCHDNAVAESFFNLCKRERVRRRTYKTRDEARQDTFDYVEMLYNPKRKHEERDAVARRIRAAAGNDNRGCLENSGLFRSSSSNGVNTTTPSGPTVHWDTVRQLLKQSSRCRKRQPSTNIQIGPIKQGRSTGYWLNHRCRSCRQRHNLYKKSGPIDCPL